MGAGPALAQTGTGLVTARKGRSPVLVISGDMPAGERTQIKYFDQRSYVESTAGNFVPLRKPATVAQDVQQAFRYVRARRGPPVLNAPADILRSEYPGEWKYLATSAMPGPFRVTPDPEAVEGAAAILATARRPVILAGKGAVLSGARMEIEPWRRVLEPCWGPASWPRSCSAATHSISVSWAISPPTRRWSCWPRPTASLQLGHPLIPTPPAEGVWRPGPR